MSDLRTGVIGLGMIGGGVAKSLINSGIMPVTYDIMEKCYERWPMLEKRAVSPCKVAEESDVIMIAVFDGNQIRSTLKDENGILKGAHPGLIIVSLSTITRDESLEFYNLCKEHHIDYLDCGVTPGPMADKNGLVVMAGGDKEVFDRAKPALDGWAAGAFYCGSSGSGIIAKLARNNITYGCWRVITEAERLIRAYDMDASAFLDILTAADQSDNLFYNLLKGRIQAGGKFSKEYGENLSRFIEKDLKAVLELAGQASLAMPSAEATLSLTADTCDLL